SLRDRRGFFVPIQGVRQTERGFFYELDVHTTFNSCGHLLMFGSKRNC
ncbi:MAG: hypothetical protein ACI8QC_000965, partial [Planctomycetota bacterium]